MITRSIERMDENPQWWILATPFDDVSNSRSSHFSPFRNLEQWDDFQVDDFENTPPIGISYHAVKIIVSKYHLWIMGRAVNPKVTLSPLLLLFVRRKGTSWPRFHSPAWISWARNEWAATTLCIYRCYQRLRFDGFLNVRSVSVHSSSHVQSMKELR